MTGCKFSSRLRRALVIVCLPLAFYSCSDCGDEDSDTGETDAGDNSSLVNNEKTRIYQLVIRLFGNTNTTNKNWGNLAENGCGKFEDINDVALLALQELGITHIWLTGVLQQATATDYSSIGKPADDADIVKGIAGSFYAVRDYYDVSPDYAVVPEERLSEFKTLVERIHSYDMKVLIDFVPNHVARSYHSVISPELDFGISDDKAVFFNPMNNFFYLVDPPGQVLSLPGRDNCGVPSGCDGSFAGETVPRATGNNVTSPSPSINDWYETVKLNYGFNFVTRETVYDPTPDTWTKMDSIIAYWQGFGIDGFRTDFSHYVPVEFWQWLISRARERDQNVFFMAEAYNAPDAAPNFSFPNLISSGFDAVYDDAIYDTVKRIYCCGAWANDLDAAMPSDYMTHRMLRYAENHDERRMASPVVSGDNPDASGFGDMNVGRVIAPLLFVLSGGPVMILNGQEVGEPAQGAEGFSGDDGKTTIFDYWAMPEFAKWVDGKAFDGGLLSQEQKDLHDFYAKLLNFIGQDEAIKNGNFYGIQFVNKNNSDYGENGHWLYSFLRYVPNGEARELVVSNFNRDNGYDTKIKIAAEALQFMQIGEENNIYFKPLFGSVGESEKTSGKKVVSEGVELYLPPSTTGIWKISVEN